MTEDVFEVVYGCRNCGAEFARSYPSKVAVEEHGRGGVEVRCNEFACHPCDICEVISCEVCEIKRHVYVEERSPLNQEPDITVVGEPA